MKKCYFLFSLLFSFVATAQIVNIPDANFKAKLLSASPSNQIASTDSFPSTYCAIDSNGDGEIQISETQNIKYLDVRFSNINDLSGIEYFVNLEFLRCYSNQLTSLNVAQNTVLKFLECENNQLTSLDVIQNTALESLHCGDNQLTSLDVTQNTALVSLICYSNQLTILDVTQNTALTDLNCNNNQLTILDVTQNIALGNLDCMNNLLTSLDFSQNTFLFSANCQDNQLIFLNIKNGVNDTGSVLFFPNPLEYVCADSFELSYVQNQINLSNATMTCHVNSYC